MYSGIILKLRQIELSSTYKENSPVEDRQLVCENAVQQSESAVHCTEGAPGLLEKGGQNQVVVEALPIASTDISRKSPQFLAKGPEGAILNQALWKNQSGSGKLGSPVSEDKPYVKMRKSQKHKLIPDRYKQVTLGLTLQKVIKSPDVDQQDHSLEQANKETVKS